MKLFKNTIFLLLILSCSSNSSEEVELFESKMVNITIPEVPDDIGHIVISVYREGAYVPRYYRKAVYDREFPDNVPLVYRIDMEEGALYRIILGSHFNDKPSASAWTYYTWYGERLNSWRDFFRTDTTFIYHYQNTVDLVMKRKYSTLEFVVLDSTTSDVKITEISAHYKYQLFSYHSYLDKTDDTFFSDLRDGSRKLLNGEKLYSKGIHTGQGRFIIDFKIDYKDASGNNTMMYEFFSDAESLWIDKYNTKYIVELTVTDTEMGITPTLKSKSKNGNEIITKRTLSINRSN